MRVERFKGRLGPYSVGVALTEIEFEYLRMMLGSQSRGDVSERVVSAYTKADQSYMQDLHGKFFDELDASMEMSTGTFYKKYGFGDK